MFSSAHTKNMTPFALYMTIKLTQHQAEAHQVLVDYANGLITHPVQTLSLPSALNTMCDEAARQAIAMGLLRAIQPSWTLADAIETLDAMANNNEVAQTPNVHAGYTRWIRAFRGLAHKAHEQQDSTIPA